MLHHAVYPVLEDLDIDFMNLDSLFSPGSRPQFKLPFVSEKAGTALVGEKPLTDHTIGVGRPSPFRGVRTRELSPVAGPMQDRQHCDSRLNQLDVEYWMEIPISNELAACVLSHYLETSHTLFGCFDPDLFLSDLVDHKLDSCSPFLFAALMCLACLSSHNGLTGIALANINEQSYSTFDLRSSAFSTEFWIDAEKMWRIERSSETPTALAAQTYLLQAGGLIGLEVSRLPLVEELRALGIKMKLFGVGPTQGLVSTFLELPLRTVRQLAHVAWETYAWLT